MIYNNYMKVDFSSVKLSDKQIAGTGNQYYIYMVTNYTNSVLYTGTTSNLIKRIHQHKEKYVESFTYKYNCNKLVYFEIYQEINHALEREKYIKKKKRAFKNSLVNSINPNWLDLYDFITS